MDEYSEYFMGNLKGMKMLEKTILMMSQGEKKDYALAAYR